jgi:hypothetical protein
MRTSLIFRRVVSFSQLYYQSAVLDYPLNHQDATLLKNKASMDEVNTNFTHILSKVAFSPLRPHSRQTKRYWTNFTNQES